MSFECAEGRPWLSVEVNGSPELDALIERQARRLGMTGDELFAQVVRRIITEDTLRRGRSGS